MKKHIFFLLIASTLFSCNMENRKPDFKRIENVQIIKFTASKIEIKADAVVYNPNGVSAYLQKLELDIFANDIKVSHISQTENTEIAKESEFKIPVIAKFKPQDLVKDKNAILNIINSGLATFKKKKIDVKYIGTATFKVAGIEFDIPIEHEGVAKLK